MLKSIPWGFLKIARGAFRFSKPLQSFEPLSHDEMCAALGDNVALGTVSGCTPPLDETTCSSSARFSQCARRWAEIVDAARDRVTTGGAAPSNQESPLHALEVAFSSARGTAARVSLLLVSHGDAVSAAGLCVGQLIYSVPECSWIGLSTRAVTRDFEKGHTVDAADFQLGGGAESMEHD
jgi:hypothetical protein